MTEPVQPLPVPPPTISSVLSRMPCPSHTKSTTHNRKLDCIRFSPFCLLVFARVLDALPLGARIITQKISKRSQEKREYAQETLKMALGLIMLDSGRSLFWSKRDRYSRVQSGMFRGNGMITSLLILIRTVPQEETPSRVVFHQQIACFPLALFLPQAGLACTQNSLRPVSNSDDVAPNTSLVSSVSRDKVDRECLQ